MENFKETAVHHWHTLRSLLSNFSQSDANNQISSVEEVEYQPISMEGLGQLIAFSLVMLFGSYMAGSLPLFMPMSEEKLHLVSVLGAGLLVGVALAVIVPEGVQTLIMAYNMADQHGELSPIVSTCLANNHKLNQFQRVVLITEVALGQLSMLPVKWLVNMSITTMQVKHQRAWTEL